MKNDGNFKKEVEKFEELRQNAILRDKRLNAVSGILKPGLTELGQPDTTRYYSLAEYYFERLEEFNPEQSLELTIRYAASVLRVLDKSKIDKAVAEALEALTGKSKKKAD